VSEGTMIRLKVQKAEPLQLEYRDVITAIVDDRLPTVSGEDGLAVLRIVQQLAESRRQGEHAGQQSPVAVEVEV